MALVSFSHDSLVSNCSFALWQKMSQLLLHNSYLDLEVAIPPKNLLPPSGSTDYILKPQIHVSLCPSARTWKRTSIFVLPSPQSLTHSSSILYQRSGIEDSQQSPHKASLHSKCVNIFILDISLLQPWVFELTDTVRCKTKHKRIKERCEVSS